MRQRYLTTSQKDKLKPFLLEKQKNICLFCKNDFSVTPANDSYKITFEHLDNDVFNNNLENLALAHKKCNNDKKINSDYQIIARAQIKDNNLSVDSLSACESKPHRPASKEIDLNVAYGQLTYDYLNERLIRQSKPALNYNSTAESIAYMMWDKTGHGSPATVKRHLDMFTSDASPFKTITENGETIIIKRT